MEFQNLQCLARFNLETPRYAKNHTHLLKKHLTRVSLQVTLRKMNTFIFLSVMDGYM